MNLLKDQYTKQNLSDTHYAGPYCFLLRGYTNLYGNLGKMKEAIDYGDKGINLEIKRLNGVNLKDLTYDQGWNYEQKGRKKEALHYMKTALALRTFYEIEDSAKFTNQSIKRLDKNFDF